MAGIRLEQAGALKFLEEERVHMDLLYYNEEEDRRSREKALQKVGRGIGRKALYNLLYDKELIESYNRMMKQVEERELSNKK